MPLRLLATNVRTSHELVCRSRRPSQSIVEDRLYGLPVRPLSRRRRVLAAGVELPPRTEPCFRTFHSIAVRRLARLCERDVLAENLNEVRLDLLISPINAERCDVANPSAKGAVDYYKELSVQQEKNQYIVHHQVESTNIEGSSEPDQSAFDTRTPADLSTLRHAFARVHESPGHLKVWRTDSPEARIEAYFDRIFKLPDGTMDVTAYQEPDRKLATLRQSFTKEIALFQAFQEYMTVYTFGPSWRPSARMRASDHASLVSVLIGAVLQSPHHTLQCLRVLAEVVDSFAVRADCLYAVEQLYKEQINSDAELLTKFNELTVELADQARWPPCMAFRHLRLLLQRAGAQQREEIVRAWLGKYRDVDAESSWNQNSRRLMAHLCITTGLHDTAIDILETLPRRYLGDPTRRTMKLCARALEQDPVVSNGEGVNFKRLPRLLQAGFQPDALLYGRIAYNALIAGYPGVAWDLYLYTKNNNAQPEPLMYVAILKFAFLDRDMKKVDELLSDIHQEPALYTHPYIVAFTMHMVRVISYIRGTLASEEIFAPMFAIYDRGYKRDVLVRLGIVGESLTMDYEGRRHEPSPDLVAHVIRSCLLAGRVASHGLLIWKSLMDAHAGGDAAVTAAMRQIVLYDGFILFWSRQASTLPRALETMRYLLTGRLCTPTAHTWSLLICGYLKHEQGAEARALVKLMEKHGMTTAELAQDTMNGTKLSDEIKSRMDELLNEDALPEYPEEWALLERELFAQSEDNRIPWFKG